MSLDDDLEPDEYSLEECNRKAGSALVAVVYNALASGSGLFASGYALAEKHYEHSVLFALFSALSAIALYQRVSEYLDFREKEYDIKKGVKIGGDANFNHVHSRSSNDST